MPYSNICLLVESSFNPVFVVSKLPTGRAEQYSTIYLRFADITVSQRTGEVDISWNDGTSLVEASIGHDLYHQGLTKNVYRVRALSTSLLQGYGF